MIQSKSIYINSKINADFIHYILPELLDVAEDRNYIFIFTDVKKITDIEVNSVFNSSLKSIFVLDNIAEFASERGSKTVFGDMDIKSLKEDYAKCELGDGYYYDVEADNLKKMKFIKITGRIEVMSNAEFKSADTNKIAKFQEESKKACAEFKAIKKSFSV